MLSNLLTINNASLAIFFARLTEAIGFGGYLGIIIAVEILFIALFAIKSVFSYEARLKRILDKANAWIFQNKKLDPSNIKEFNDIVKKGPKRFAYYWQQFILNREGGPATYMTEENIIEKPLRTSSWKNNVRNLGIMTGVWAVISFLFGFASQSSEGFSFQAFAVSLLLPCIVLVIGLIAIIAIKGKRVLNLDDIYHLFHIFTRFVTNACDTLPPYIDFNLLFTPKEIENGNAQIREYYEEQARRAKEEFEAAEKNETSTIDYNFRGVGVDGALLLERAMKESDAYLTTKNATLSQIAQVEAQKEALRRSFEEKQMDFQRKLQASKENIEKLIEQQNTTTNRFEIGRLRERQDKEVKRQEQVQSDLEHEEAKFDTAKDELDREIEALSRNMVESLDKAEKGMTAEYQSFFKKVMKSAYAVADNKVKAEKNALIEERDSTEAELINVQSQIKRLLDENITLRARIEELSSQIESSQNSEEDANANGQYDSDGNFIYEDGSFHDNKGFFHDVDGKIYDMNGALVSEKDQRNESVITEEELLNEQVDNFGSYIEDQEEKEEPAIEEQDLKKVEELLHNPEAIEVQQSDNAVVEEESKEQTETIEANEVAQEESVEKRGKGRPRKVVVKTADGETKKRGRPKKEVVENNDDGVPKKRGRPRKNAVVSDDDIANINDLISAEEEKLNAVKTLLDNSIDEALELGGSVERDKEEIIAAVEALKEQAASLEGRDDAGEELAKINKRIEDLIREVTALNNK